MAKCANCNDDFPERTMEPVVSAEGAETLWCVACFIKTHLRGA